jgi:EAL domain-containing protein (putative c-di-GMP-specific phosphodiesterase class I)
MKTVSEGVEKDYQVEFLRKIRCDMIQGYVFSKPVTLPEFEKLLFGFEIEEMIMPRVLPI